MGATMARRAASADSLLMRAAGAPLIPASTANAAERDGACDSGEVCLYYNSNGQGLVSDFKDVGWRRSVSTSSGNAVRSKVSRGCFACSHAPTRARSSLSFDVTP